MTVTTNEYGQQNMFAKEPDMVYQEYNRKGLLTPMQMTEMYNGRWAMMGIIAGLISYVATGKLFFGIFWDRQWLQLFLQLLVLPSSFYWHTLLTNFLKLTKENYNEKIFYSWGRDPQRTSCNDWFRCRCWCISNHWTTHSWSVVMILLATMMLGMWIFISILGTNDTDDDDDMDGGMMIPAYNPI